MSAPERAASGAVEEAVLIQPPFVQLNSPYPALYYLKSFLEARGVRVTVRDHSIALFERIFSRPGLERIFRDASLYFDTEDPSAPRFPGGSCTNTLNRHTARIIRNFLSGKDSWLDSIDRLVAFLRGKDPGWGHFLALANGCVPAGPRAEAFLAERNGTVSPDGAKALASELLADLADFINCTLDSGFNLIRYSPVLEGSLNTGFRDFSAVRNSLSGYIMNTFYRPMLSAEWETPAGTEKLPSGFPDRGGVFLLGLTVPFPGCLAGALVCAESARKCFGSAVRIVAGGGYVNTELRFLDTPDVFDYFDYLSFDRGYGSLVSIMEHIETGGKNGAPLYKTMYRQNGTVAAGPGIAPDGTAAGPSAVLEDTAARTVFPDYSRVDFGRYICPVDGTNPMHRLWSDGHWLKAYLAHGCYWHSCAFCDTSLDYVKNFVPAGPAALFAHLKNQAEKTGVRGIHLVDEAAPVSSLLEFALLNRGAGLPLNFWGNIRFEKDFDTDTARILAAGGLTGVSAGLEVATARGLRALGKGISLTDAVKACAAFKESGILTHAYLIYGYWDEDEQEITGSAEILRQFFEQGLLDSAFWHQFVLTRHSRIYAEKQRGLHPRLTVKEDIGSGGQGGAALFALNDLSFKGGGKFNKYTAPLEALLGAWMNGAVDTPVSAAFPFRVKAPQVPPDFVKGILGVYASDRDKDRAAAPDKGENPPALPGKNALFLGSRPIPSREGKSGFLRWRWQLQDKELKTNGKETADKLAALVGAASGEKGVAGTELYSCIEETVGGGKAGPVWAYLRENGLALFRAR